MSSNPLISVIIPLYNKENSIKNTIQSVLNQQFDLFELIIVDDGSTDNSLGKLREFNDSRIKIVSKKNGGVSEARNYGVRKSTAKYIFFLDADDIILPGCLSTFYDLTQKYSSKSVFTSNFKISKNNVEGANFCSQNTEQVIKNPFKSLWTRKIFPRTGSMLIERSCFDEIGFFNPEITVFEDLDLIIRLLKKYKLVYTPKVTLLYKCEYNSLSNKSVPISKEWASYIDLSNAGFYEKLIKAENIFWAYAKRYKNGEQDKKVLLKKYKANILIILFTFFYRKALGARNRLIS